MILQDDAPSGSESPPTSRRNILQAAVFLGVAGTSAGLTHVGGIRRTYADLVPLGSLDTQVPSDFDGWTARNTAARLIVDPTAEQSLADAYDATLARRYANANGRSVELVLAYVRQVTDSHRVHDPEICYPAQGYDIRDRHVVPTPLMGRTIPTTVFTVSDGRDEAQRVHYWIVEGPNIASTNFQRKLKRLNLGFERLTPDGTLIRMSTQQAEASDADALLVEFTAALFQRIPVSLSKKLLGTAHAFD